MCLQYRTSLSLTGKSAKEKVWDFMMNLSFLPNNCGGSLLHDS